MRKMLILTVFLALLAHGEPQKTSDEIMALVSQQVDSLASLECVLNYTIEEDNGIFETTTLYSGKFCFERALDKSEKVAVIFFTKKEDDATAIASEQRYIFDGTWLTKIDKPLKEVSRVQLAPEGKPVGALDLLLEDFPIVGFGSDEKLKSQYDIKLITDDKLHYLFKLKPIIDSEEFKYSEITLKILKKTMLPQNIKTTLKDGSGTMEIDFKDIKINKKIDKNDFIIETPKGFSENVRRLEDQNDTQKGEANG